MRKLFFFLLVSFVSFASNAQLPCSRPEYRQLDFWLGEWEAYGLSGKKAGDSKISMILDSCVILEEWSSATITRGLRYSGKSFNTFNTLTRQWQQTWVDNTGATTEYLQGKYENNQLVFLTAPFRFSKDTMAIKRLSLTPLGTDRVRQLFETSKDNGLTWKTDYDLDYRRKK